MKNFALVLIVLSLFVAFASCGGGTEQPSGDVTPPAVDNGGNPEEVKYSQGLEFISRGEGSCSLKGIGSCTDTDILIPPTSPSGEKVTAIDASAFEGVTSILSVTIPEDVTEIGHYAFKGCTSLSKVSFSDNSNLAAVGYECFYGCKSLASIVIPADVTNIGIAAFKNCTSLVEVTFGEGSVLQGIGFETFRGCTSLLSVAFPDSITSIGESAFRNCTSFLGAVLPEGVTSIGDSAFEGCSSLSLVKLPASCTTLGKKLFAKCESLARIRVAEGNEAYLEINGSLYSKDGKTLINYAMGKNDKKFEIPAGVTTISAYAFAYGSSLNEVVIPSSVTIIDDNAFLGCNSLTKVVIPTGVTTIGKNAFYSCTYLESVEISSTVTSIGTSAFYRCNFLSSIKVAAGNTRYKDIDGNLYSKDGRELIQYAIGKTATEFKIPTGVTTIKEYAFHYCGYLKTVSLSENGKITNIERGAFSNCESLISVVIPYSVTKLGRNVFSECTSLSEIRFTGSESQWTGLGLTEDDINNATVRFNSGI